MTQKKSHNASKVAVGIAGLTAAAVGAYYLYGHKDATKNREAIKDWIVKTKGEINAKELQVFMNGVKKHWTGVEKDINKRIKKVAKKAKLIE